MTAERQVAVALERFFSKNASRGLVSTYLFGSHAEGRAHRDSDVDVAVLLDRAVLPEPRDRFAERVRLAARLPAILGVASVDRSTWRE